VEDHPLDYAGFEGVIPEGNYGAGTVMIWDKGTYHVPETTDRKECERILNEGLQKGHLKFVLQGQKLKGEFSMVRFRQGGKKENWLLVKKRDQFATGGEMADSEFSAASQRSMEQIAEQTAGNGAVRRPKDRAKALDLNGSTDGKMPTHVRPMLATLVEKPFDRKGWFFEVKWDGYRAIAEVTKRHVRLYSRNQLSFEQRYRPVVQSLKNLGHEAVLDGEVAVLDAQDKPSFELLQNYQKTGQGNLVYFVFDLLYLDGEDLQNLPLKRRKELLVPIIKGLPHVQLGEHVEERGVAFFEAISEQGLEGMIAKDAGSPYRQGLRSGYWLKVKTHKRQEAVIGGFTKGRGRRKNFGALVLGVYDGKDLIYIGHTGGGFNETSLALIRARLDPLIQDVCPFKSKPKTNAPVQWVRPKLVCEVSFSDWTSDGKMRQPIFVGLREDKDALAVRREEAKPISAVIEEDHKPVKSKKQKAEKKQSPSASKVNEDVSIDGHVLHLTNLQKVYWPDQGYTKKDLIDYYREISAWILPYLQDRPQSLHRHPDGIAKEGFFQKDVGRQPPSWVETVAIHSKSDNKDIRCLICQNEATLVYLANLGCIELNPWNSRVGALDNPDYLVIDLDPETVPFRRVIETAQAVRKLLDDVGAESFCKTSGKRGLHIYVPLGARYSYDQAKQFAEIVANLVQKQLPAFTSVVRSPQKRLHKVYLDFLQNRRGQTLAAPYALRPTPQATVSTPLKWQEVVPGLDLTEFTMQTTAKRLQKVGDLWRPVLGAGIDLEECLNRLLNYGGSNSTRSKRK
jgi:bifunctional non-homologous end joining protein LigD